MKKLIFKLAGGKTITRTVSTEDMWDAINSRCFFLEDETLIFWEGEGRSTNPNNRIFDNCSTINSKDFVL